VLLRYPLLRALHADGINNFNVYRPEAGEWPERFPVFLRRESFHTGALTGLLHDETELREGLRKLQAEGIPLANLIMVEFAAEPAEGEVYRKLSAYRIGDYYFRDTAVNETGWSVRHGEIGISSPDFYADERASMNIVPHETAVRRAFHIGNIDYGRADLGFYKGQPQIYEINTNPTASFNVEHPIADRSASRAAFVENYKAAIADIDQPEDGKKIVLDDTFLNKTRKRSWRPGRSRHTL
jgi:hypothetical protein